MPDETPNEPNPFESPQPINPYESPATAGECLTSSERRRRRAVLLMSGMILAPLVGVASALVCGFVCCCVGMPVSGVLSGGPDYIPYFIVPGLIIGGLAGGGLMTQVLYQRWKEL